MIAAISEGGSGYGLMNYLVGPGRVATSPRRPASAPTTSSTGSTPTTTPWLRGPGTLNVRDATPTCGHGERASSCGARRPSGRSTASSWLTRLTVVVPTRSWPGTQPQGRRSGPACAPMSTSTILGAHQRRAVVSTRGQMDEQRAASMGRMAAYRIAYAREAAARRPGRERGQDQGRKSTQDQASRSRQATPAEMGRGQQVDQGRSAAASGTGADLEARARASWAQVDADDARAAQVDAQRRAQEAQADAQPCSPGP